MKHRVSYLLLAATTMLAAPAWAAPVFMLQFGSFETRDEAQQRLTELQGKHGGVLSSMNMNIREVTLPPDNLTVYRTQAGPVESRASAQSVCSQLASNGDECYVVETAMLPQAGTAVAASGSATAPLAAPPIAMNAAPTRDASSVAMMNAVSNKPALAAAAAEPKPAAAAAPVASPELQKAMDVAAAEQDAAANAAPTPPGAKEEGSFWSRMNPFSSSEPAPAPAPVPTPKAPALAAAPAPAKLPSLEAQAAATPPLPPLPPQDTPMIAQRAPVATPAVAPQPPVAPQPVPMAMAAPAPAPSMQLPPPPAPLIGKGSINQTAMAAPAPAPAIVPQTTGTVPAPQQPAPLMVPPPAGTPMASATNNVQVGEAKRVPLSTMSPVLPQGQQLDASRAPIASQLPQIPPPVSLSPSATLGEKTLWAQIGLFKDAQDALAYWSHYRQTHPDFPVVRVRVNNNYQAALRGHPEVSLRVGPFAREGALRNLCATIKEGERELRCGTVVDMGMAGQINGPREGFLSGSRYRR